MRTRKTTRARAFLVALACVYLAAVVLTSFAVALLALSATLAYAYMRWSFLKGLDQLDLRAKRRVLEPALYADVAMNVEVEVEGANPGLLGLRARDAPPTGFTVLQGSSSGATPAWGHLPKWRYAAMPAGRGSFRFGDVTLEASDAWGLFEATLDLDVPDHIRVNAALASVRRARAYAKKRPFDPRRKDPLGLIFRDYEFEGVREYVGGDRLRDIDWKATTRLQELMTKTFEREMEGTLYCIVDASRTMRERTPRTAVTKLDHAAEMILQVGEIAAQRNFAVGLIVFDEAGLVVDTPASRARGQERVLAAKLLSLPQTLSVERRLDAVGLRQARADEAEAPFLARVASLRPGGEAGGGATGPRGAVARLLAQHAPGSLFVFAFSDFATAPDALADSLLRLRDRSHTVAAGLFRDDRYLAPPGAPTLRDLENAYRAREGRSQALRVLRSRRVNVVELAPSRSIADLLGERG